MECRATGNDDGELRRAVAEGPPIRRRGSRKMKIAPGSGDS